MTTVKNQAIEILTQKALTRFDAPVELASGKMSSVFVDVKAGLATSSDLTTVCSALVAELKAKGISFDAVGGPTMGAVHLAVGMSMVADSSWFFVRKAQKERGSAKQIEGASLASGTKVVIVEDAISTGGSVLKAIDVVQATGAEIVAVTTPIDRGDAATESIEARGLLYLPLARYSDLGLDPV